MKSCRAVGCVGRCIYSCVKKSVPLILKIYSTRLKVSRFNLLKSAFHAAGTREEHKENLHFK